ncbi:permease [Gilvimarinus sp. SDUM040013]|uniref:Permease n=1 Tax=Gilvimarinus gilvus TaxID=3058038 RepID=A0ABU4RV02_9GAMM|nr:permease [Gilvimarinus sp. SDUM040013]MDO3387015.1 permease [Gilvimarinus sp. SDUM040013]MDX6848091.1 permease [Gilvimarinus sp. SDUM040013]
MVDHCHSEKPDTPAAAGSSHSCCEADAQSGKSQADFLLWGSLSACAVLYLLYLSPLALPQWLMHLSHGVFELLNTMWWGVALGVIFVGLLHFVPQSLVASLLGRGGTVTGILRATAAGVFLDLCSHGILMVGMKLYQKGASLGQVMAFLIASPWNSLSLTLVMIALIGLPWTLAFIVLSMVIAVIAGLIFDALVARKRLECNANTEVGSDANPIGPQFKQLLRSIQVTPQAFAELGRQGLKGSRMVLRWLLFGVLLASVIRAFVPTEIFAEWFGPTFVGLLLTAVAATIIEVCSEGSTPIAADLMNRARAPGNSFLFLMAGVATDYTEIMVIKDTMKSWKTALFLPLVVLPQVLVVAVVLNLAG